MEKWKEQPIRNGLIALCLGGLIGFALPVSSQLQADQFQEVAGLAGITYVGESYGVAWGDFNADGYPDLWLGNHPQPPHLYVNNGNGTFTNRTDRVFAYSFETDTHGAAWADFNRDGFEDLIELTEGRFGTGENQKLLYVNRPNNQGGRVLRDRALEWGLDYPAIRGRTPLWLDFNGDGRLDVLYTGGNRSDGTTSALFRQVRGDSGWTFTLEPDFFLSDGSRFATLADLTGDRKLDLICDGVDFPQAIFEIDPVQDRLIPMSLSALGLPITTRVKDVVFGDFNGDLRTDLLLLRGSARSDLVQVSETRVEALLYPSPGQELGFRFSATGHVLFQIQQGVNRRIVFIGASGFHPAEMPFVTLSSDDPNVVGIMPHTPGVDEGVYLGYEPSTHTWTVLFSTPAASPQNETRVTVTVDTQTPITQTAAIGFNPNTPANAPVLLLYNPSTNRFVDRSQQANLSEDEIYGNSVVAGDFDNDMDVDLYVVCTEVVLNSPNVLYENRGAGRFRRVANGGGAIGSERGRGDTATVVDYNLDGFLDLLVTNGQWPRPFSDDGPTELFRNRGNKNHWIEIDLVGTRSNPDGIGASVILQTPDGRRQLREQSGGMHLGVQNHKRLHFGLGSHTTVTSIQIYWPSGAVQTLTNLTADRILKVVEP